MLKSSSSEKKLVKSLKNCFSGPNLHRKGVIMDQAQDEKKFFLVEITKADHQLSESFCFIKISYVLTESWIFFYLQWCFLSKKCHFQLKQLCLQPWYVILISPERQFNWVSDVFYFMKNSALVFELCYFKDTWLYFTSQNS